MPHIIVEYSGNLKIDVPVLLNELHHSVDGKYNVALERIKTRAYQADQFVVGEHGSEGSFIHIELKLAPGRTDDMKKDLAIDLKAVVLNQLPAASDTKLTVEVSELHGPSYQG